VPPALNTCSSGPRNLYRMAEDWTADEEIAARAALNFWRGRQPYLVTWDWADMLEPERRRWVERARQPQSDWADDPEDAG
jgi:hypothetical protein